MSSREMWGSKLGFLLAAIGSAVGLGNIWRFGYTAYEGGGGAFLVPYAVALVVAGVPLMILEYALGHRERASPPLAFARIKPLWEPLGWWMPIIAFFGINLFYTVVIGWCMNYFIFSFNLSWGADTSAFFFQDFLRTSSGPLTPGAIRWPILAGTALTWLISWIICYRKISHGIEKASMIFIPLLFVLTLILVGWSLQLEGALDAIKTHYLSCDFSKIDIRTAAGRSVWVAAFGQIFFSLGLGFGIMVTYASYLPRKTGIVGNALATCITNCLYSFIAGFAVFGTIGYMAQANGLEFGEAIKAGPGLAFVVYPEAINQLPMGNRLFGVLFFLVLIVAGLSSAISLTEAFTCSLCDKFKLDRRRATGLICTIGLLGSLVFTTQGGFFVLDIVDHFVNNYALVIGGIMECVLVGWVLGSVRMRKHVNATSTVKLWPVWDIAVRIVTPLALAVIVGAALLNEFNAAYGGYSVKALLLLGGGTLLATRLVSFILSHFRWTPEQLQRHHEPSDDDLMV